LAAASVHEIYTIFEGTSEIQRLVVWRAMSGMRISS
jgi:alkylation response protein AidB-like acyl-CoA dehydrogenase